jgi:hypothetical protein
MPVANDRGPASGLCNDKRLFSPLAGRLVPKRPFAQRFDLSTFSA